MGGAGQEKDASYYLARVTGKEEALSDGPDTAFGPFLLRPRVLGFRV